MNIAVAAGPTAIKFYLEHYWARWKASLGFGIDRIKPLVSMATDSSHGVIMGEILRIL